MSRSPTGASATDPQQAYLDAWQQLAQRIQRGESFSGRERNCVFLNTGGARFADVSSVTGLDLIDDSRSVALSDWDQDGDLDLWISNRTGPRVRFLRNDLPNENQFIAFHLKGDPTLKCPRDAIGARVELTVADSQGIRSRRIQTLAAGNGFLSQSSKRLFFGLAAGSKPVAVHVRWPGSTDLERFQNLAAGQSFTLAQGTGLAEPITPRPSVTLAEVSEKPLAESPDTRVWLLNRLQTQPLDYQQFDGQAKPLSAVNKGPILVTLWATWCAPCLEELEQLGRRMNDIQSAGARVLALNIEGVEQASQPSSTITAQENARQHLTQLQFTGEAGMATQSLVEHLDELRRAAIYRQDPMPIPASFLIDASGQLCVLYTGAVSPDQLLEDLAHLDDASELRRARSVPFAGRWAEELFVTNPIAIADIYRQELQYADAMEYLERYLSQNPVPDASDQSDLASDTRKRLADVHQQLGRLAVESRFPSRALEEIKAALTLNPDHTEALTDLGDAMMANGRIDLAIRAYQKSLVSYRAAPPVWNKLGLALLRSRRVDEAVRSFQQALRIDSFYSPAANNLAWLWATYPDETHRRGTQAVRLAEELVRRNGQRADVLDTLAAAYAETGDFDRAAATAQQAIDLANELQQTALAQRISQRLELYQSEKTFRDAP